MKALPQIAKRTFWDVDITEYDYEHSSEWIITRVFDRGTLTEVLSIINYYGFDVVKEVLTTTTDNLTKPLHLTCPRHLQIELHRF